MGYKVKYQKDSGRPYTVRKTFATIQDAQDYVEDIEGDFCELIYEIFDEDGNSVFMGAFCN